MIFLFTAWAEIHLRYMWQGFLLDEWTWHSQKRQTWDTNIVEDISYLFLGCDKEEKKSLETPFLKINFH